MKKIVRYMPLPVGTSAHQGPFNPWLRPQPSERQYDQIVDPSFTGDLNLAIARVHVHVKVLQVRGAQYGYPTMLVESVRKR